MVDPIPVPSSQTGGSLHQSTFYDELQDNTTRLSKLERVSRLGNASIGEGGLRIYSAGELQWFDSNTTPTNFCPDLRDLTTDPNGNSHLSFIIRTIPKEETTGDFSQASLLYYYPYEGFCSPVVWLGRTPDFADGPGDSHGIEVRMHTDGFRAFHASEDGLILGRHNSTGINSGDKARVLSSVKGKDDYLNLYADDSVSFSRWFHVGISDTQSALIYGGLASAAPTADMQSRLALLSAPNIGIAVTDIAGATFEPVYASAFVVSSSETIKKIHGDYAGDSLADVMGTPIKDYSLLIPPTTDEVEAAKAAGKRKPRAKVETKRRVGPVAEQVPAHMFSEPIAEMPGIAGIDLNAGLWTLWRAVQQQQETINEQATKIIELETQLADFRQRLTAVENR